LRAVPGRLRNRTAGRRLLDPVADYAKPNGGIIFPNPNAPTGCLVPLADIEGLLQANRIRWW
jgi:histidinol-phosphate/aromatic aminotransferase/cobyric acid decarboxylase-like protein